MGTTPSYVPWLASDDRGVSGRMAGAWHTHKTALGKGAVERVPGWGPEGLETWKARGDRQSAAMTVAMADV